MMACAVQEQEFQHNVIDAVVLVLLSIAGADLRKNMEAARGTLPKAVSKSLLICVRSIRQYWDIQCAACLMHHTLYTFG